MDQEHLVDWTNGRGKEDTFCIPFGGSKWVAVLGDYFGLADLGNHIAIND